MRSSILAITAVLFATSLAIAQPPGGRQGGPPQRGQGGQDNGGPGQAVLMALDTDGNHEISAQEIANAPAALKTLDTNGDGILSDADMGNAGGDRRNSRGQRGGNAEGRQRRGRGGPGGEGPGAEGQDNARGGPGPEQFVSQAMEFDADGDGKLSQSELATFAQQLGPPQEGRSRGRRGNGESSSSRPQRPSRPDSN